MHGYTVYTIHYTLYSIHYINTHPSARSDADSCPKRWCCCCDGGGGGGGAFLLQHCPPGDHPRPPFRLRGGESSAVRTSPDGSAHICACVRVCGVFVCDNMRCCREKLERQGRIQRMFGGHFPHCIGLYSIIATQDFLRQNLKHNPAQKAKLRHEVIISGHERRIVCLLSRNRVIL